MERKVKVTMNVILNVLDSDYGPVNAAQEFMHAMIDGEDGLWFYFGDLVSMDGDAVLEYECNNEKLKENYA